uniref:Uncharacterized protein n=1 Tax=Cannabis sativa TaxID=3483 RepID=A0A803QM90_CANSA
MLKLGDSIGVALRNSSLSSACAFQVFWSLGVLWWLKMWWRVLRGDFDASLGAGYRRICEDLGAILVQIYG